MKSLLMGKTYSKKESMQDTVIFMLYKKNGMLVIQSVILFKEAPIFKISTNDADIQEA